MNYRVYEPGGEVVDQEIGIVYFNHMGSSVSEDTGRDAQIISDQLGVVTVAVDRPGTGSYWRRSSSLRDQLADDHLTVMGRLGEKIADVTSSQGLERILIAGRSAGGLAALALCRTETLPTESLYVAETAATCEVETLDKALALHKEYGRCQKELIASDDPDLVRAVPGNISGLKLLKRNLSLMPLYLTDKYHYQQVWRTAIAWGLADDVAVMSPDIDVTIDFAEFSIAGYGVAPNTIEEFSGISRLRRQSDEPFTITRVRHTTHSSFDNIPFLASRIQPSVGRMLAKTS